jgi:hypothetical protein
MVVAVVAAMGVAVVAAMVVAVIIATGTEAAAGDVTIAVAPVPGPVPRRGRSNSRELVYEIIIMSMKLCINMKLPHTIMFYCESAMASILVDDGANAAES